MKMMIRLITILMAILLQVAYGEACINNGTNADYIDIYNCNGVSYQNLARNIQTEKITKFAAGSQNNEFPKIDNEMFRGMINLDKLWLYDCKIENIDENTFADLKVLSLLSLQKNKIKTFRVNTFSNLENLKELFLYENEIKELPAGFFEILTELEALAINDNKLEIIHGSTFRNNKKLKKLWVYSNNIRAVAAGTFVEVKKLTLLDLENNTCINKLYGSNGANDTIDLAQVSSDLSACYDNYEASFRTLSELAATREDLVCPTPSATPITIYASIVTILLIISIFVVIKSSSKDKNPIGHNNFAMEKRSSHYYSQAD